MRSAETLTASIIAPAFREAEGSGVPSQLLLKLPHIAQGDAVGAEPCRGLKPALSRAEGTPTYEAGRYRFRKSARRHPRALPPAGAEDVVQGAAQPNHRPQTRGFRRSRRPLG